MYKFKLTTEQYSVILKHINLNCLSINNNVHVENGKKRTWSIKKAVLLLSKY